MAYNLIECNREQMYLMPPSLQDWLPEGDLAWFIVDAVERMDVKPFYAEYRTDGWGRAAFMPEMMVALLLYAYCLGERSSRRIERLCERDVAFRVITANHVPDHTTIARFRQGNGKELEGLFVETLRLCAEAGLVKAGLVALDGTKIKANAALAANRTHQHLECEVKKMLAEAAAKDAEEDTLYGKNRRGDELPEHLRERKSRLKRLKECKERLEREAKERAAEQARKIAERKAEEEAGGKSRRGRKPRKPDATPRQEAKANVTDPESRIMKTRRGYVQGYNAQAVVAEGQVIIAAEVTQQANDVKQLRPMLERSKTNLAAVGIKEKVGTALADAGYWSETNVAGGDAEGEELFIATTKDWKQRQAMRERPSPRGRIPKDLSRRERMERKLLTERGRRLYKKRSWMVEPVFGQVKHTRGCETFMRRGLSAVGEEWKLICTTHNLLKLFRSLPLRYLPARGLPVRVRTQTGAQAGGQIDVKAA